MFAFLQSFVVVFGFGDAMRESPGFPSKMGLQGANVQWQMFARYSGQKPGFVLQYLLYFFCLAIGEIYIYIYVILIDLY